MRLTGNRLLGISLMAAALGQAFAAAAFAQSAERDLPAFPGIGIPFAVSITLHPQPGTTAAGVVETPPIDWTVSNISSGGSWDVSTLQVKWGPIFNPVDPTVLTYDVTAPPGAAGNEGFTGTVSFGGPDIAIGGDLFIVTIPAVSTWGLVIFTLLLLSAGTLAVTRKEHRQPI